MFLGLFAFSLSLMSFTSNSNELNEDLRKVPKLVWHTCPDGTEFGYYEVDGYSDADYDDMISSVCD